MESFEAAAAGVWLHGKAGEAWARASLPRICPNFAARCSRTGAQTRAGADDAAFAPVSGRGFGLTPEPVALARGGDDMMLWWWWIIPGVVGGHGPCYRAERPWLDVPRSTRSKADAGCLGAGCSWGSARWWGSSASTSRPTTALAKPNARSPPSNSIGPAKPPTNVTDRSGWRSAGGRRTISAHRRRLAHQGARVALEALGDRSGARRSIPLGPFRERVSRYRPSAQPRRPAYNGHAGTPNRARLHAGGGDCGRSRAAGRHRARPGAVYMPMADGAIYRVDITAQASC